MNRKVQIHNSSLNVVLMRHVPGPINSASSLRCSTIIVLSRVVISTGQRCFLSNNREISVFKRTNKDNSR
jgi:hypothetical protein